MPTGGTLALVPSSSAVVLSSILASLPFRLKGLRFFSYAPTLTLPQLLPSKLILPPLGILRIFTSGTNSFPSAPFFKIGTSRLRLDVDTKAGGNDRVESALLESTGRPPAVVAAENEPRESDRRANVIGYLLYISSASDLDR